MSGFIFQGGISSLAFFCSLSPTCSERFETRQSTEKARFQGLLSKLCASSFVKFGANARCLERITKLVFKQSLQLLYFSK